MRRAIELAQASVQRGGGPFGAVVARAGRIVAEGANEVTLARDPTAHAEIVAIRAACQALNDFKLTGCSIYTSCEPCPMCLGAIYWSRAERLIFAATRADAAGAGFDDDLIYREIALPIAGRKLASTQSMRDESLAVFRAWASSPVRREY